MRRAFCSLNGPQEPGKMVSREVQGRPIAVEWVQPTPTRVMARTTLVQMAADRLSVADL